MFFFLQNLPEAKTKAAKKTFRSLERFKVLFFTRVRKKKKMFFRENALLNFLNILSAKKKGIWYDTNKGLYLISKRDSRHPIWLCHQVIQRIYFAVCPFFWASKKNNCKSTVKLFQLSKKDSTRWSSHTGQNICKKQKQNHVRASPSKRSKKALKFFNYESFLENRPHRYLKIFDK